MSGDGVDGGDEEARRVARKEPLNFLKSLLLYRSKILDTGGPVVVSVNFYLRSISKIDDVNMEYSAQFTFREEWWDARLAYERLADENTHIPPFVVLATSDSADLSRQM